jgi:hypothetical protein
MKRIHYCTVPRCPAAAARARAAISDAVLMNINCARLQASMIDPM